MSAVNQIPAQMANLPFEIQGAYIPPTQVVIASIFYKEMVVTRSRRAPVSRYVIPAGTREKPGFLVVNDAYEGDYSGGGKQTHVRILAEQNADDIMNEVTTAVFGTEPNATPGIFRCAGSSPTKDELDQAEVLQRAFYLKEANEARAKYGRDQQKDITPEERAAATALGIVGEKWQLEESKDTQKMCPICAKYIPKTALKCTECGEWIEAKPAHLREIEDSWKAKVAEPETEAPKIPVPSVKRPDPQIAKS